MAERKPNRADWTADEMTTHHLQVMRYGETVRKKMMGTLFDLADKVKGKVGRVNFITTPVYRQPKRQRELFTSLRDVIASSFETVASVLTSGLQELAKVEASFGSRLVARIFGGKADVQKVTDEEALKAIKDLPVVGVPVNDWLTKSANDLNLRAQQQVRLGVATSARAVEIAERIAGTDTGKQLKIEIDGEEVEVPEVTGGILQITQNELSGLARTSTIAATAMVMGLVAEKNGKWFRGEQWMAHLDQVTCIQCAALDGSSWDFDGKPLPESPAQIKDPGPTPIHNSCRCIRLLVPESAEELDLSGLDLETRDSLDGKVAASINFERWLRAKPVSFQRDILGPGRWRLWAEGRKLSLQEMLDPKGNALTLKELRSRLGIDAA